MEKRIYVSSSDCSKCMTLRPWCEKAAISRWIEMVEEDVSWHPEVLTIPTLIVRTEESERYLTDEDLVRYIQP